MTIKTVALRELQVLHPVRLNAIRGFLQKEEFTIPQGPAQPSKPSPSFSPDAPIASLLRRVVGRR